MEKMSTEHPVAAERDTSEAERIMFELDVLTKGGIVEVAVRNPNVADYMAHWEKRAERAEAAVAALRAQADEPVDVETELARLDEVADGAWGDNPMTRGLARDEAARIRSALHPSSTEAVGSGKAEQLFKALEPFAACVFNDNGDVTVDSSLATYDDFVAAYFAARALQEQKR